MEKTMAVEGMKCMHCKASVEKALKAVDGVLDAEADLESKAAVIRTAREVPDSALIDAVKKAGFEPGEIR